MVSKTIALGFLLATGFAAAASAAEVNGFWEGPIRHVIVRVEACDDAICGNIVTSDRLKTNPDLLDEKNPDPQLRGRSLKGLALFYGLKGGPPKWSGGHIYNPDDGNTYRGSVELVGEDKLILKGCVLGFICKSQQWFRVQNPDGDTPGRR